MNGDGKVGREPLVKIKISHLSQGKHSYHFVLASTDFQDAAVSTKVFPNPVEVSLSLDKGLSGITVDIVVSSVAILECDRCLATLHRHISGEYRIFYSQAKSMQVEDWQDEIRWLGRNDFEIDLTDDVRDTLLLAVPMKNVCEPACMNQAELPSSHPEQSDSVPESEWQKALHQLKQKFNENLR